MKNVAVIRPYLDRIRNKMFSHLEQAGCVIDPKDVIPQETDDAEVIRLLATRKEHIWLMPFNAHQDASGKGLNGLDLLLRIQREHPDFCGGPVLMPVSESGTVAVRMMLAKYRSEGRLSPSLERRILFIAEQDMDRPELVERIRKHINAIPSQ